MTRLDVEATSRGGGDSGQRQRRGVGRGGGSREERESEMPLDSRAALWKWAEGFCMTSSTHRPAEVSVEVCRK